MSAIHNLQAAKIAASFVLEFENGAATHQDEAERMLGMLFGPLFLRLMRADLENNERVCLFFIGEYFSHRGDWKAMRACLESFVVKKSGLSPEEVAAEIRDLAERTDPLFTPNPTTTAKQAEATHP